MSRIEHAPYTVEEELWRLYRRLHTYEAWTYDLSDEMRQRFGSLAGIGLEGPRVWKTRCHGGSHRRGLASQYC
jgi:hypothetical protein